MEHMNEDTYLTKLIEKGKRIYCSDERSIDELIGLFDLVGIQRKAIWRLFDVIILGRGVDRTFHEILNVDPETGELLTNKPFATRGEIHSHILHINDKLEI